MTKLFRAWVAFAARLRHRYSLAGVEASCALCGEQTPILDPICYECGGEPFAAEIDCEGCDGEGRYEYLDRSLVTSRTISPPYREAWCDDCEGEGTVEPDEREWREFDFDRLGLPAHLATISPAVWA